MKIGICDDEKCFIEGTRHLVEEWAKKHNIFVSIYEFTNGDDLISSHQKNCMDLIILDVIMPLFNGIDTAKELRIHDQNVPVIFLTSSREYAVDSYDVHAFYYLMKPLKKDQFFKVMDEFLSSFNKKKETFLAKIPGGNCNITLDETVCLEAQNKEVIVYLANGTQLNIKELFSDCAGIFTTEKGFFKCHRSYIVNMKYIEQFTKTQLVTKNGMHVPVSRNNYAAFKKTYFSYMFQ